MSEAPAASDHDAATDHDPALALAPAPAPDPDPDPILDPDERWLRTVYAGDAPQLTIRAVATGMVLGGFMALSNLYINLKLGWSLGVTITAAILAFACWSLLRRVWTRIPPFGVLENNAMQSVASAAGYMTGGGTVAAIPALMMVTGQQLPPLPMALWIGTLAFLGVFVAIPLKRQFINVEQLRFPSGLASAETVRSLHSAGGGGDAAVKAKALGIAAAAGAILAVLREGLLLVPRRLAVFGKAQAAYTLEVDTSLILVGVGALMGPRSGLTLLGGSLLCYGVLAPMAHSHGAISDKLGFSAIISWSVWIGASMMLTAGLLHFGLAWKAVGKVFSDIGRALERRAGAGNDADRLSRIEVPSSWFAIGLLVLGPLTVYLEHRFFAMPLWMGALTIVLALLTAVVAARSTGETDNTPTGPIGKLVQLVFGGIAPGNMVTNLMAAQATAGVALHASDLLTDLKSGYVLGAKPRQQFFAQFFGVVAGTLVVVPAYHLLIPDVSAIGGDRYPAPAAQGWAAVARLLGQGMSALHPSARWGLVVGSLTGIVLALLERLFPRRRSFIPSPIALGMAFTLPAWNSISIAAGSLIAWALERRRPAIAALFTVAVASGLIAGESLLGALVELVRSLAYHHQ
ncbi:MAG: OPT family oligopeptide transporter [Pseudomonadota bacterium]